MLRRFAPRNDGASVRLLPTSRFLPLTPKGEFAHFACLVRVPLRGLQGAMSNKTKPSQVSKTCEGCKLLLGIYLCSTNLILLKVNETYIVQTSAFVVREVQTFDSKLSPLYFLGHLFLLLIVPDLIFQFSIFPYVLMLKRI